MKKPKQVQPKVNGGAWILRLLACGILATGSAGAQVSLKTVVDLTQRNSTAVRLANADVEKARAILAEGKDVIIPSLTFSTGLPAFPSAGFTGYPPSLWTATVQSLVFGIPQKKYVDSAKAGLRAAMAALKEAREQSAFEASTCYLELDSVNRKLEAARAQEELAARLVDIEQQRAEAGVDPVNELLQARLTAANIRLARLHLETRAATLSKRLDALTGLPVGSITPEHSSIPEIPGLTGELKPSQLAGIKAAQLAAIAKAQAARGDELTNLIPQLGFFAQYNRSTTLLNNANYYYAHPLPPNNFSSGISLNIPLFDMGHRAKARESVADALRARVEAEQAQEQNDVHVAELTASLKELSTLADIAGLKQQIAADQLKSVQTLLENGNGAASVPGGAPQLSPKAEELARIDERQKFAESLDAELNLSTARLALLRSLGHMQDWLDELRTK